MKRNPKWIQENPRDQARAILAAAQIDLHTVLDNKCTSSHEYIKIHRIEDLLAEVQTILYTLSKGSWDPESK